MLKPDLPAQFNAAEYFVDRNVEEGRGDQVAILFEDRTYTYNQLLENVNRAAGMLAEIGVQMENRVMLLLRDSPEVIFSFFGAIKLGAVPIPTNILMKSPDFLFVLNDSRARVLIVDSVLYPEVADILNQAEFLEKVVVVGDGPDNHLSFQDLMDKASTTFQAARTTPDDAAFWLYSGRNPERLMAAVHHHSHLVYCAEAYAKGITQMTAADTIAGSFLFFAYGLGNSVYLPLGVGASTVLANHRPLPELVYQDLVRYRPTILFTVPTLMSSLAAYVKQCREEGKELPPVDSLRLCVSSAEILSPEVCRRFREEFLVEVLEGTGSTEICHIFLSNRPGKVKVGSTGPVVPGYEARLVDEDGEPCAAGHVGHLLVSGGSVASAYWNQREETTKNMLGEWFVTGDRYTVDEEGYYFFRGRSDDMLRVGGKWVAPSEVEKAINRHPAVAESAVVGFKDERELVQPYGFVVLKSDYSGSSELGDEIKDFVKAEIAKYKYPRGIEFVDHLPKSVGGKIQRFELQERLEQR